jgi:hypothetical protein
MIESPRVEVRCPQCDVSFPIGTKRCIHCGGSTVEPEVAAQITAFRSGSNPVILAPAPLGESEGGEDAEEEGGKRRSPRSLTILWILMAVAASIYRTCTAPG